MDGAAKHGGATTTRLKDLEMKCNSKTMLSVALALGLAGVVVYFAFPAAQSLIAVYAPILLALICPVSMLVMMWAMKGSGKDPASNGADDRSPTAGTPQVGQEKA